MELQMFRLQPGNSEEIYYESDLIDLMLQV